MLTLCIGLFAMQCFAFAGNKQNTPHAKPSYCQRINAQCNWLNGPQFGFGVGYFPGIHGWREVRYRCEGRYCYKRKCLYRYGYLLKCKKRIRYKALPLNG